VPPEREHILVIRLGALGDLVFCFQSFHEIRQAHPEAEIALLVRAPYADFARSLPWFNRIIIDTHPTFLAPRAWWKLRREIADFRPKRVYDFQGKFRQTVLYALLGGPKGPAWSGAASGCKFPRPWPPLPGMSWQAFMAAQLRSAGVPAAGPPDLSWFDAPIDKFALPKRYAVLIPGCSPKAPHKRWPAQKFAEAAKKLQQNKFLCVAVGTKDDAEAVAEIKAIAPDVFDLCGQTSLFELAGIVRRAALVIGNDTGPVHMAAALGAPTLAIFSEKSDPVWSKPPGPKVAVRQTPVIADFSLDEAIWACRLLLQL
jgi:ADP-heptose:LPS heptosyltransferase